MKLLMMKPNVQFCPLLTEVIDLFFCLLKSDEIDVIVVKIYCLEIYRLEAVGQKNSNYTLKITIFSENVKFGTISCKLDILPITASEV